MPRIVAWNVQHRGSYENLNKILWEMGADAAFILEPGVGLVNQAEEVNKIIAKKEQIVAEVKQIAILAAKTEQAVADNLPMAKRRALEAEGQYKMKTVISSAGGDIAILYRPGVLDADKHYHLDFGDRKIAVIKVNGIALASGHSPYQEASGAATTWTAQVLKTCKAKGIEIFMGDVNLMGKAEDKQGYINMLSSPTSKGGNSLDRVYLISDYSETADFTTGRVVNTNSSKSVKPLNEHDMELGCDDLTVHLATKEAKYFAASDHMPIYVDI